MRPPVPTAPESQTGERVQQVALSDIVPSSLQPRKEFAREALDELMESIRQHGIIQPLVVRPVDGKHELIAGERRWRAAQQLGLAEVPVIAREATDLEVLELSLIENLQRADLNPIEESRAYERLANEFGMRQEDIAQKVGRSRAAVANSMRLLELHPQVQTWLTQGLLSVGHAKVLLGLKRRSQLATPAAIGDLQQRLQEHLGTRVTLHHSDKGGRIEIEYYSDDDLDRLAALLGVSSD